MYFVSAWRIRAIHAEKIVSTDHVRLGKKAHRAGRTSDFPGSPRHMVKSDPRGGTAGPSIARLPGSLLSPSSSLLSRPSRIFLANGRLYVRGVHCAW
jgi:hypothetical protein